MSIRERLARILLKGHEALSRDRWHKDPDEQRGHLRRGGVQFTTTGALEAFCRTAFGRSDVGAIQAHAGDHRFVGAVTDVVAQLAELPASTRRSISVQKADWSDDALRMVVRFSNYGLSNSEVRITGTLTAQDYAEAKHAVDSHTTPLTWNQRRRGVPVLLPATAKEEFQEDLRRALTRKSALWGALAGFATSALALLLQSIVGWP